MLMVKKYHVKNAHWFHPKVRYASDKLAMANIERPVAQYTKCKPRRVKKRRQMTIQNTSINAAEIKGMMILNVIMQI